MNITDLLIALDYSPYPLSKQAARVIRDLLNGVVEKASTSQPDAALIKVVFGELYEPSSSASDVIISKVLHSESDLQAVERVWAMGLKDYMDYYVREVTEQEYNLLSQFKKSCYDTQ